MIWREKRIWLIVLGVALAADIFVFVTYRVQFQRRIEDVEARKVQAEEQLAQAKANRRSSEQTFTNYRRVQADLDNLYNTRWATETERFTTLINEVKRLAAASQLTPPSYTFARMDEKEALKTGIGTSTVAITFTVQGNYQQIRRLINLLELSEQFVIIDSLAVSAAGGDPNNLNLSLRLKTLFRAPRRPSPNVAAMNAATGPVL
jgi:hypothetical protein